jgi:taurine dioxygenase
MQFPHRKGWHTDQSFRLPPPDISLFYAVREAPMGQGQTLFADGTAAYAALHATLKARIEDLQGVHARPGCGRSEQAVKTGQVPQALEPNQRSQHQPVVRVHPVTGKRALYLCDSGQMDWIDGPFVGMQTGPYGDGAKLLYELLHHYTQPVFTYAHHWERGDLVIYDNRSLMHSATWFDASMHGRIMWRTTVKGNPGAAYSKESWSSPAA